MSDEIRSQDEQPTTADTALDQLLNRATDALGAAITNRQETERGDHR